MNLGRTLHHLLLWVPRTWFSAFVWCSSELTVNQRTGRLWTSDGVTGCLDILETKPNSLNRDDIQQIHQCWIWWRVSARQRTEVSPVELYCDVIGHCLHYCSHYTRCHWVAPLHSVMCVSMRMTPDRPSVLNSMKLQTPSLTVHQ